MKHGIETAAAFLLFLSEGVLDRPFCTFALLSPSRFMLMIS
jgi:hypothetical protein